MNISGQPLISVLMPVFNGDAFVALAIESILNQSHKNFEFIIIDDGSTDKTADIIRRYRSLDDRIIFITRENRGLTHSLNEGLDMASGKWIARMDADDISLPDRFEKQLTWLHGTGADICGTWIKCFGGGSTNIHKHPASDAAIKTGFLFGCLLAHPTVMVKTSLMKANKYDAAWNRAEDYELWTRLALNGAKFTNIPEVLLQYRVHSSQISVASITEQKKLSQQIRRNYWNLSPIVKKINPSLSGEFLKLYDPEKVSIDMSMIDRCMSALLLESKDESRSVLKIYGELAYIKASGLDASAPRRWRAICKNYGLSCTIDIQILMIAASYFKNRNSSFLIKIGKYFYSLLNK